MRFNDFLFAAHGAVLCVVIYSQFFPSIWNFTVGKRQRISSVALAIWWACVASIVAVLLLVKLQAHYGHSSEAWEWIDVASPLLAPGDVR